MNSTTRTIIVLSVLFLIGGLHALVGFLPTTVYNFINEILLAIEGVLQIGTAMTGTIPPTTPSA